MGMFWQVSTCTPVPNQLSYLHPTDGIKRLKVVDYETALANNDQTTIDTMDYYLNYKGFAYYEDTPTECIIDEDDE